MKRILQFLFVVYCLFTSTNLLPAQWIQTNGPSEGQVQSLFVSGSNLFAGTVNGGVYLSTDNGTSWTVVNAGLTNTSVKSFAVYGLNLFAGSWGSGVWRRPLSEMVTSVEKISTASPTHFSLQQNNPNPFNPSTAISFSLPSQLLLSLKVFDALGREVSTLVSEELPAGTYSKHWDAAALPSGIYFYRLQAGEYLETKRMILLK